MGVVKTKAVKVSDSARVEGKTGLSWGGGGGDTKSGSHYQPHPASHTLVPRYTHLLHSSREATLSLT